MYRAALAVGQSQVVVIGSSGLTKEELAILQETGYTMTRVQLSWKGITWWWQSMIPPVPGAMWMGLTKQLNLGRKIVLTIYI